MSDWLERYERSGWLGRVGLIGGGAVKLVASVVDKGLDRAASVTVEAKQAFQRELDPNMSSARILEESDEPFEDERNPLGDG